MATIPPWLNIDPVAPVGRLLEGYRAGLSASEAQNASARAAQAQAQQAQQLALAQAQAEQLNAYRQQQQAIQLEQLRMEQQKAEREASSAALQLEGQRGIQAELEAGANWPQALAKWAPKLFAGKPDDLARAMQIISPPQPPIFGKTPEGIPFGQDYRTGNLSFPPVGYMKQDFTPQIRTIGEGENAVQVMESSPGNWRPVREKRELSQIENAELQNLARREAALYRKLGSMTEEEAAQDPTMKPVVDEIDEIGLTRNSIYLGTWKPGAPTKPTETAKRPLTVEQAREFLRQAGGDKEKARKLARDAGFEF